MKEIEKDEWIGLKAKIYYNDNKFKGKIIDETKNTITIKTKDGEKKFLKQNLKIEIDGITLDGKKLTKRPEERIKNEKKHRN